MANRLDPTWAHLPAPAPTHAGHAAASHYYSSPTWLSPAAAFENEALTSALRASMAPATAAAAASSYPTTPSSSSTSSASDLLSGGHDAAAPTPASSWPGPPALARPKAGRVAKRKRRPSRRAQTTYISADAANFRRMVQEITGFPVPGGTSSAAAAAVAASEPSSEPSWPAAPACVLPTLDTSAFLLDRAMTAPGPGPELKVPSGGSPTAMDAAAAAAAAAAAPDEEDSSMLLELEAMVCAPAGGVSGFPTLESCWEII